MSKKSRRKTLSHTEIETFLSDLEEIEETCNKFSLNNINKENSENIVVENFLDKDLDDSDEVKSVFLNNQGVEENVEVTEDLVSPITQLVRNFCDQYNTSHLNNENICNIAMTVYKETNYILLPARMREPDSFVHPASSLESKKAVLLSLSPMLTDAERQRKGDSIEVETFTRCRVDKGRDRSSYYDYIDIDTNLIVDPIEYQRRYILYLHSKSKTRNTEPLTSTLDSNSLYSGKIVSPATAGSTCSETISEVQVASPEPTAARKKSSRRMTLSPAAALAVISVDMENKETNDINTDIKVTESISNTVASNDSLTRDEHAVEPLCMNSYSIYSTKSCDYAPLDSTLDVIVTDDLTPPLSPLTPAINGDAFPESKEMSIVEYVEATATASSVSPQDTDCESSAVVMGDVPDSVGESVQEETPVVARADPTPVIRNYPTVDSTSTTTAAAFASDITSDEQTITEIESWHKEVTTTFKPVTHRQKFVRQAVASCRRQLMRDQDGGHKQAVVRAESRFFLRQEQAKWRYMWEMASFEAARVGSIREGRVDV